jgi:predicted nucleic acid-binding protein
MMSSRHVLLDNTALTNFALVGRPDLVLDLWGPDCATTTAVMTEYQAGIASRGLPAHSWDDLIQLTLQPAEQTFADQLPPQLGSGERSCIAIAIHRQGLCVCDDAKARLEETMRAALNELATEAPIWLQSVAPAEWYKRYGRRIEDDRLPQSKAGREAYGQRVGEDRFHLLDLVVQPDAPAGLDKLPMIEALRLVWERH